MQICGHLADVPKMIETSEKEVIQYVLGTEHGDSKTQSLRAFSTTKCNPSRRNGNVQEYGGAKPTHDGKIGAM